MKLQIDNFDGSGLQDYTAAIEGSRPPQIIRKLHAADELRLSLVADGPEFVVPATGARVLLELRNGQPVFTGYMIDSPVFEYLGWRERGPAYRYKLIAVGDQTLLDSKRLPDRCPFVERSAGDALRQLTQDALPDVFDPGAVQSLDTIPSYASDPQKKWSEQAGELATAARACFRLQAGALSFTPAGATTHNFSESDGAFSPQALTLQPVAALINDVTVIGEIEPQAYVKDYFIGDGLTLRFYLSQTPFIKTNRTLVDEEYTGWPLDPTRWSLTDPAGVVVVSGGRLHIAGGTGVDGATVVQFAEQIEMGGALVMQHGDVTFDAASSALIGGLYTGSISISGCLAGFQVTPNGAQSRIQALINGTATGAAIGTVAGHHYVLTTRLYSQQIYRSRQRFHSSVHPAGQPIGGSPVNADVRIVLEAHDIDPSDPTTWTGPSTVLYDGVISTAPGFCLYALVDAANLHCAIAFTRLVQAVDTEVRTALPGEDYVTALAGSLRDGAECEVTSSGTLEFYPQFAPAAKQLIRVQYRGQGRALARVTDPLSIAAQQRGVDNGLHGISLRVRTPPARSAEDCENAALALLDDSVRPAWTGEYETWSDGLPANADIFPGDGINVLAPSRGAAFAATVREVDITIRDLAAEHSVYKIRFANDAAAALAFAFETAKIEAGLDVVGVPNNQVGHTYLADLTDAEITSATSTSVTLDAGVSPPQGGGFEVRWSDVGWGAGNDRNLIARSTTRLFSMPRLARVQTCYLRQYDASVPPKYSRFSAALHLDYPYE